MYSDELAIKSLLAQQSNINRQISSYTIAFKGLMGVYILVMVVFMSGLLSDSPRYYLGVSLGIYMIFLSYSAFYVVSMKVFNLGLVLIEEQINKVIQIPAATFETVIKIDCARSLSIGNYRFSPHVPLAFTAGTGALIGFYLSSFFTIRNITDQRFFVIASMIVIVSVVVAFAYQYFMGKIIKSKFEKKRKEILENMEFYVK